MSEEIDRLTAEIQEKSRVLGQLQGEIGKVIVGQGQMIKSLFIGLLGNGHVLLEGAPGLAKTLIIKTLADALEADFSRIQFTPDLLPADVVGTLVYNMKENDFSIKKGPVFTNFLLADEINRAPAKVQSALLEAMQERQVTIGEETYPLREPFLVLATQNPIDQEGTYPLPEAQMDRFMLKTLVDYPTKEQELEILTRDKTKEKAVVNKVLTLNDISELKALVKQVYIDKKIESYIVDLVFATRFPSDYKMADLKPLISFGSSPRGSINLSLAARCFAFMEGRAYVVPEDVRAVLHNTIRHRIGLTYEAEAEGINTDFILDKIVENVQVP